MIRPAVLGRAQRIRPQGAQPWIRVGVAGKPFVQVLSNSRPERPLARRGTPTGQLRNNEAKHEDQHPSCSIQRRHVECDDVGTHADHRPGNRETASSEETRNGPAGRAKRWRVINVRGKETDWGGTALSGAREVIAAKLDSC